MYGSTKDSIPGLTDPVSDGEMFWFPAHTVAVDPKIIVEVWETPCHTKGHLVFVVNEKSSAGAAAGGAGGGAASRPTPIAVFTGDTLFTGGTGKFFEGSAEQMTRNLERLAALPSPCKLFCGHEYTLNNYKFAAAVEPDNLVVAERCHPNPGTRTEPRTPNPETVQAP